MSEDEARRVAYLALEFYLPLARYSDGHYGFNFTREHGRATGCMEHLRAYLEDVLVGEWEIRFNDNERLCAPESGIISHAQRFIRRTP